MGVVTFLLLGWRSAQIRLHSESSKGRAEARLSARSMHQLEDNMVSQPLHHGPTFTDRSVGISTRADRILAPLGRVFYSLIFIASAPMHFTRHAVDHAASQGVPMHGIAVPLAGIIALLGGLSILVGYRARIGAWLVVLFLVPVTIMMHRFWSVSDPQAAQMQFAMFMKNVSMLGGAFLIAYFGAGPVSFDARRTVSTVR
jgi:putative oxidoreductase